MLRALAVILAAATCVSAHDVQPPCADLLTCAAVGVDQGLQRMQKSSFFPLLGKRVYLERREDATQLPDLTQGNIFQRAGRLLETHDVKAPITNSLSVKLFKTPQGPFDISLDVGSQETVQGRTFFKRRLQMALLPIMYKLGVMTTLLGVLVVMVAKGLAIGVILLILAVASAVKHKAYWGGGFEGHASGFSAPSGYATAPQPPVHVHLHGLNKETLGHASADYHSSPYSRSSYVGATAAGNEQYLSPYNRAAHLGQTAQAAQTY
ncbi:Hypothetical predicted protein [Cloeon dipterum]|uniref:Protein osiris 10 n=1 Tax=Cloeon dipterum TaxID=197152 RepID=A0A8S1D0E5_9INSE|nr:Hypothetical predicted protein [Cloeon dipterum]